MTTGLSDLWKLTYTNTILEDVLAPIHQKLNKHEYARNEEIRNLKMKVSELEKKNETEILRAQVKKYEAELKELREGFGNIAKSLGYAVSSVKPGTTAAAPVLDLAPLRLHYPSPPKQTTHIDSRALVIKAEPVATPPPAAVASVTSAQREKRNLKRTASEFLEESRKNPFSNLNVVHGSIDGSRPLKRRPMFGRSSLGIW